MRKITFMLFSLFAGIANASVITVDYEVTSGGSYWGTGSFSGVDSNSDGLLTFEELTIFSGSNNSEGASVILSTLDDVGDFNFLTNTWLNNALGWTNNADNAWFTWNNRNNSVNSSWASVVTTSSFVPSPVPVPATMLLFALGLIGLGITRKKRFA